MAKKPHLHPNVSRAGLTLVELAIVITILALLTGAVLGGVELKRTLEMRSILTDMQKYEAVASAFKTRYGYLPGDLPNATDTWGWAPTSASPVSNYNDCAALSVSETESEGKRTCNGNGDKVIAHMPEPLRFWQHLSNAGMADDNFSGVGGPGSVEAVWPLYKQGYNCPASSFRDTCWAYTYSVDWLGSLEYQFNGTFDHHYFQLHPATVNAPTFGTAVMSPTEMYELDQKYDDGMPATGQIITQYGGASYYEECTTKADGATQPTVATDTGALYNTSGDNANDRHCSFFIRSGL